jgi:hypothetical protein
MYLPWLSNLDIKEELLNAELSEIRRNINLFLGSIKYYLDRSFGPNPFKEAIEGERFLRMMRKIEDARLRANTYLRSPDQLTNKEWDHDESSSHL